MNPIVKALILLTFAIGLTNEQEAESFEVREHTLVRPYPSVFSTVNSHWHLCGNAIATDRYIRLTGDVQSRAGGLWNMVPVAYADWEMHVHFHVHGEATGYFGDGLVIWYARDPLVEGPAFGYRDHFHGLAIVLDTYANYNKHTKHNYPYISAIVNNGTLQYHHDRDGIDINIAGCEASFRGRTTDTLIAIRYQNNRLAVSTDIDGANAWHECFAVDDIFLPTEYHFGFSAATGQLSDNHDIVSVRTYQLGSSEQQGVENRKNILPAAPSAKLSELDPDAPASSGGSALKSFSLVLLAVVICLGGIGAFVYMKRHRHRPKRFY